MKKCIFLWVFGLTAGLTGCQKQAQGEQTMPICFDSVSVSQLFSVAEKVLTDMYFQIDKADQDAGQIITRPLRGAQFFELWRKDNVTAADGLQSNLQSLQRIAEVRLEPVGSGICVNCRVIVRRLSMPDQPIRGRSRIYEMYTQKSSGGQGLQIRSEVEEQVEWIYLGSDPNLEQLILQRIQREIQQGGGQ